MPNTSKAIHLLALAASIAFSVSCQVPITRTAAQAPRSHTDYRVIYRENIHVQTEPPGARIYIQDEFVGVSPVYHDTLIFDSKAWCNICLTGNKDDVYPTQLTIQAFKPNYSPAKRVIIVDENDPVIIQNKSYHRTLYGDAFRDGKGVARTSAERNMVIPLHQSSGFSDSEKAQQQQQQQTIILPNSNPNSTTVGSILVSSSPKNGDVFIDGFYVGNTPSKLTLEAGLHIVEVKLAGHVTFRRELRVLKDSDLSINADLKKE